MKTEPTTTFEVPVVEGHEFDALLEAMASLAHTKGVQVPIHGIRNWFRDKVRNDIDKLHQHKLDGHKVEPSCDVENEEDRVYNVWYYFDEVYEFFEELGLENLDDNFLELYEGLCGKKDPVLTFDVSLDWEVLNFDTPHMDNRVDIDGDESDEDE